MYSIEKSQQRLQQTQQLLQTSFEQFKALTQEEQVKLTKALSEVLRYHDWRYYVVSDSIIEDVDYDYLFDFLQQIETAYPTLSFPDSPIQRVAKGLSDDFTTVEHTVPMLSLGKAYNEENVQDWATSLKKLVEEEELTYVVEPKFDGASIALIYENDLLVRGATRGNGVAGDEITNNLKTLATIPLTAKFSSLGIHKIELRGEALIHKEKFVQLNKERAEKGEKLFSNARNTASGALRQKKSERVAERKLEAFIYQVGAAFDKEGNEISIDTIGQHSKGVQLLYQLGFKTALKDKNDTRFICKGVAEVLAYCQEWQAKRADYPYEIDGMVIKLDDLKLQSLAGATGHHPRWAIALKFDAKEAITVLEDVEFQVGRTGAITPVAKLKTVNLAGANISNASLHNEDFIKEKEVKIGDKVVLQRAGDVIPYIVRSLVSERTGDEKEVVFPTNCPVCESDLVKPEGESVWRCENMVCSAKVEERVIHYVSKQAMDIRGLGKDIVKRFFQEGFLTTIVDIYKLSFDKIEALEGWGKRSATKLQESIEASKNQPLARLLIGLGIREVGKSTAKLLGSTVKDIEELQNWTEEQLQELPDIGPKVAANIVAFFQEKENLQLIEELKLLGVNTQRLEEEITVVEGKFTGKSFLFTGALQQLKRSEAKKLVEDNGGKVISAVSKKLDYLVVGEKAGSKLKKAQKTETINIITEEAFIALVN